MFATLLQTPLTTSHKRKPAPAFIPVNELAPFVEKESELPKADLLQRISGNVEKRVLYLMKLLQFHHIYKDKEGNLYLN